MDKALKQRLVGATILIALAVIFLPMLLDGPSPESPRVIAIDPPERGDFEFETRRLPLDGSETAPLPAGQSEPRPVPTEAPPQALPVRTENETPVPDQLPADPGETSGTSEPDGVGQEPLVVNDAPAEATVSEDDQQTTAAVSEPESEPPATAEATASPATGSTVAVQVASLSSADGAAQLRQRLEAMGFDTDTEQVAAAGGELIRVRAVGFADAAAAGSAAERIAQAIDGVTPRVVGAVSADTAGTLSRWVVQVGSFSNANNADNLVQRLREAGFQAFSEAGESGGRTIHKVRVGPELQRGRAESLQQRIASELQIRGMVVSYP